MNYKYHYDRLIETRRALGRVKKRGSGFENHHIIPTSCGGSNTKDNIIVLTSKEHYFAHLLLVHMYEGKQKTNMAFAIWMMTIDKTKNRTLSSRQYEYARSLFVPWNKGKKLDSNITRNKMRIAKLGTKRSIESIQKGSNSLMGKIPWNKGLTSDGGKISKLNCQ